MLRSNALFVVIVMSLVIGIIISAFVLLSMHYRFYVRKNLLHQRVELNAASGVELILAEGNRFTYGVDSPIDLFGTGADSVFLKKMRWGIFDVGVSRSCSRGVEAVRAFQIGSKPGELASAAVYLVDEGSSLAISGKTLLKGVCYLPEAVVRPVQISGNFFSGTKLVDGAVKRSATKLPPIDNQAVEKILDLFDAKSDSLSRQFLMATDNIKKIERSFRDTTMLVRKSGPLTLTGNYSGNIILMSDTLITILSEASLTDVVIVAPEIIVKEGFQGNFQAFASKMISVENNCVLAYPSVLGIIKKDFSEEDQPSIVIQKGSVINGFVFSYQVVEDLRRTLVSVEESSEVVGQIYSDGYLQVKGMVKGGVMCRKFVLNSPSSFYENYLLNATIDHTLLSSQYLAPSMLQNEQTKNIVKWLR
jgi:hypothetical protein